MVKARFLDKFTVTPGCWLWRGAITSTGYGHMKVGEHYEKAHRIAWRFAYGVIPDGLQVCHRCDNPPCVNPDHLFLGTQVDNLRDCYRKGRMPQFEPFIQSQRDVIACPHGHDYTQHVYLWRGKRYCRECRNSHKRLMRAKRKVNGNGQKRLGP